MYLATVTNQQFINWCKEQPVGNYACLPWVPIEFYLLLQKKLNLSYCFYQPVFVLFCKMLFHFTNGFACFITTGSFFNLDKSHQSWCIWKKCLIFKYKWKFKGKSHLFSGMIFILFSFLGFLSVCTHILHDEWKCTK